MKLCTSNKVAGTIQNIPNTIFNVPGPLKTASVALYWSPYACLPMQMGFFHPATSTNN
jgi:hypothetical protein